MCKINNAKVDAQMDFYIILPQKLQKGFVSKVVPSNIIAFAWILVQVDYMPQVVIALHVQVYA